MPRVPELTGLNMTGAQRRVAETIADGPRGGVAGPLKVWLHSPELADRAQRLGEFARYGSSLPARLSELAILVTARHWTAQFEWHAHAPEARRAGLSEAVIAALADGRTPVFAREDEAAAYEFANQLLTARRVGEPTYRRAEALLGRVGVIELVGILGYYALISMTINAFEVEAPDGSMPLAPIGPDANSTVS